MQEYGCEYCKKDTSRWEMWDKDEFSKSPKDITMIECMKCNQRYLVWNNKYRPIVMDKEFKDSKVIHRYIDLE